jgi:hypothetical protein
MESTLARLVRERRVRERRLWLGGALTGAAVAFLLDPQLGRRRRTVGRDRIAGSVRRARRRGGRRLRRVGTAYRARLVHRMRPRPPVEPDDVTLKQKIETELFRPADVPKGQINVNVQNGVVQLRGEVPRPEMIRELVEQARKIAGVRDVEDLLHLPNTPPRMHQ